MILHVYTVTWNESYMMPYFLRHYETVADHIFVIDDSSTDGTREIVEKSPKAQLLDYPYPSGMVEPDKAKTFSRTYRTLSRGIADWVICVDCDEFIYHPNLRAVLERQRALGAYVIRPDRGMILGAETTPVTDGQLYDACPLGMECPQYAKPVILDPGLDVWFGLGQHRIKLPNGIPIVTDTGIELLHCCYLSRDWINDHLDVRFSRMPPHELERVQSRGMTLELAKKRAMISYDCMRPWR